MSSEVATYKEQRALLKRVAALLKSSDPITEEDLDVIESSMTHRTRRALLMASRGEELWGMLHSAYA